MNISLNDSNALSGVLKIEVEKSDYEDKTEKNLREIRQKVNMPGFRKGMVPLGMVKKLYGGQVLAEELNKVVAKAVNDYIKKNKIEILGEPVPNETEQKKFDLENDERFEFCFDLAYRPEFDLTLSKEDKLIWHKIKIDDELVDKQIDSYTTTYGAYEQAEKSETDDMLKGLLVELVDGEPKPDGIMIESVIISPKFMKEKTEQEKFVDAGISEKIVFNPFKAYKGEETEIASLLKIDIEKAKEMKNDFSFEINEITRNKKAALNQELFDKIFGEGAVNDETEFRERTKAFIASQYAPESKYKFIKDFHKLLLDKTENIIFADDILKRWWIAANENKSEKDIEREYPLIVEGLKYQLAKEKLVRDFGIEVYDEDVKNAAEHAVKAQFAQYYGMMSVPENLVGNYVEKMLEKQETVRNLVDKVLEEKLTDVAKEKISIEEKEVTSDEFFSIEIKESEAETKKNEDKNIEN
jgi:trigger factor